MAFVAVNAKIADDQENSQWGRWAGSMARKLKTYQTSLGFYDLAIAAPSMKAALEAWGAGSNLFHQGVAKESSDPEVVADTMSKPGIVLRRPVGSNGRFGEHAELPTDLAGKEPNHKPKKTFAIPKKEAQRTTERKVSRKGGTCFREGSPRRNRARNRAHHAPGKRAPPRRSPDATGPDGNADALDARFP